MQPLLPCRVLRLEQRAFDANLQLFALVGINRRIRMKPSSHVVLQNTVI